MVPTKTYQERVVVSVSKRGTTAVDKVDELDIRNEVNNEERKKQRSVKSSKGRSKAAKVGQRQRSAKGQSRVAAAAVKNLPAQKRDPQSPPNILLAPSLLPWHQKI